MIFLEEATNQALAEEGQVIVTLEDLGITWPQVERLFVGTYNQAKIYVPIYKQEVMTLSPYGLKVPNIANIRHIVYNSYQNMQRFMPDILQEQWEFNPYLHELKTLVSTSFNVEYATYSYCGSIPYSATLNNVKKDKIYPFKLPCQFVMDTFKISNGDLSINATEEIEENIDDKTVKMITLEGELGEGKIDVDNLEGYILLKEDADLLTLSLDSKYSGILELDLTCELFYTWYKANLLALIGSMKEQIDLPGVGLPFDINKDTLLTRARELSNLVEQLKGTKSYWSGW